MPVRHSICCWMNEWMNKTFTRFPPYWWWLSFLWRKSIKLSYHILKFVPKWTIFILKIFIWQIQLSKSSSSLRHWQLYCANWSLGTVHMGSLQLIFTSYTFPKHTSILIFFDLKTTNEKGDECWSQREKRKA